MQTEIRPQLRRDLRFVRHENDAGISYVIKDPHRRKYFRFGQVEAWLMQAMDGSRTLSDICDELHEHTGLRVKANALDVLVRRLREMGLVERSPHERSALLMEQLRNQRKLKREGDNTLLRMRVSFGDPDRWIERAVARLGFFWTKPFVVLSVAFFMVYTVLVFWHWNTFMTGMTAIFSPAHMTMQVFLLSYVTFAAIGIIHELGHGFTCKRFGGEVHEIGAMVLYFAPAFFCNISDAWTFEKRSHRLWVTFAGGWVQLWCAALAAVVWLMTEPGTIVHTMALFTAIVGGSLSLLLNYNPLIPLDGYYALVDWLEMPNLRARSFEYLGTMVKRHVFRMDVAPRPVTDRERRVFLTYGACAAGYTTALLTFVALFVGRFLTTRFGGWGWLIFLALFFAITTRPRAALLRFVRVFAAEKLPHQRRRRLTIGVAAASVLVVVACAVTPWTVRGTGTVVVEPAARHWLRPTQTARLTQLLVQEGARVRAGDTLAVLRDPELELERNASLMLLHQLESRAVSARAGGDAAAARLSEISVASERARLTVLERVRRDLVLRASVDGVVVTPRVEDRVGEMIVAGDSLVELWSTGAVYARILMPQRNSGELTAGARVRVRFPAYPRLTWSSRIDRIESAADDHDVIAAAVLPAAPEHTLLPGMMGYARVDIVRTTLGGAMMRTIRRVIRLDLLL